MRPHDGSLATAATVWKEARGRVNGALRIWANGGHRCWLAHVGVDEAPRERRRLTDREVDFYGRRPWWHWCCSLLLLRKRKEHGERQSESREKGRGKEERKEHGQGSTHARPRRIGGGDEVDQGRDEVDRGRGDEEDQGGSPPTGARGRWLHHRRDRCWPSSLAIDGISGSTADKI